jgi:chitodextrinase
MLALGALLLPAVAPSVPARAATHLFTDGFESGSMAAWTNKGLAVQGQVLHSGTKAARGTSTGLPTYAYGSLSPTRSSVYYDVWFDVLSQGSPVGILRLGTSSGTGVVGLTMSTAARLQTYDFFTKKTTTGPAVGPGWHEVQVHVAVGTATSGLLTVWLDGAQVPAFTSTASVGTTQVGRFFLGNQVKGRTYDIAYDDVTVDTSYIGSGQDTSPPSTPQIVSASATTSQATLSWSAATDDTGVAGYDVYLNGTKTAAVGPSTLSYTFTGLACKTSYTLGVDAYDAAGNLSQQATATVQTSGPCSAPPPPSLRSILTDGQVTSATAAGFTFSDAQTSATFVCSLDGAAGAPCTSPTRYYGLAAGTHTFSVQAQNGDATSTAATLTWTVQQPDSVSPCGAGSSPPSTYQHVVVFVFENENYSDIIGGPDTPYTTQLANQCGQATNDFALARPSLPNYIALTSGSTQGITDDKLPTYHPLSSDNVFHQVQSAGMTWGEYSSHMPSDCDKSANSDYYVVHHEPALYYTDLASTCAASALPLGTTSQGPLASALDGGTLPNLVWIGPCDDGGDKVLGGEVDPVMGDFFLRDWIARIVQSPAYQSGSTAIIITWDEGDLTTSKSSPTYQNVPLIVVAPSIAPGTTSAASLNHYAVLKAIESALGLPLLGGAADPSTGDLRAALGF